MSELPVEVMCREAVERIKEVGDDIAALKWDLLHGAVSQGKSIPCPACEGRGGFRVSGACEACEGEGTQFVPDGTFRYGAIPELRNLIDAQAEQIKVLQAQVDRLIALSCLILPA